MLDIALSPTVPEVVWQALSRTASLPCPPEHFLATENPSFTADSRRSHQRIQIRGRAVMRRGETLSGVYTIDISPKGLGLYAPVQLFPKEQVKISMEQREVLQLVVISCRRVQESCYRCGMTFQSGPMTPVAYRNLLRELEA